MPTTKMFIGALVATAALALGGCGDSESEGIDAPTATTPAGTATAAATASATAARTATGTPVAGQAQNNVNVDLKEFTIAPGRSSVPTGDVTFRAQNSGTIEHELLVIKTDSAPADLPMDSDGAKVDTSKLDVRLSLTGINAGESKTEDVRLAAGKYVLLCNLPAHYKSGMVGPFTVTP